MEQLFNGSSRLKQIQRRGEPPSLPPSPPGDRSEPDRQATPEEQAVVDDTAAPGVLPPREALPEVVAEEPVFSGTTQSVPLGGEAPLTLPLSESLLSPAPTVKPITPPLIGSPSTTRPGEMTRVQEEDVGSFTPYSPPIYDEFAPSPQLQQQWTTEEQRVAAHVTYARELEEYMVTMKLHARERAFALRKL